MENSDFVGIYKVATPQIHSKFCFSDLPV